MKGTRNAFKMGQILILPSEMMLARGSNCFEKFGRLKLKFERFCLWLCPALAGLG